MTTPAPRFPALLAHAVFLQIGVYVVRPTTSYMALDLGADPALLGLVVASFSVLPVLLAVWLGRLSDAGREPHVLVAGAALLLAAGAGLLWATPSLPALLAWNALLGIGHLMSLLGEQSRLASLRAERLDRAFGVYTMLTALGQAAAPLLMGLLGGGAVRPDTSVLLLAYLAASAAVAGATAWVVAGTFAGARAGAGGAPGSLREALAVPPRTRGILLSSIGLSMMVLCAIDLLQVYLPALAVERGIPVAAVGVLLALRALATVASRAFLDRLVAWAGRGTLILGSTAASAVLLSLLAVPAPLAAVAGLMVAAGLTLGVGQPLSMTVVSLAAAPGTKATWMALRLTGTRLGQVVVPAGVGLAAAVVGAGGVFAALGAVLAAVTAAAARPLRGMDRRG